MTRRSSAGCGARRKARRKSFPSAPARFFAARRGSCGAKGRPHTGRRSTFCRGSAQSRWTSGSSSTADFIFAAGVTAGIDGALRLVADVRGVPRPQRIQLDIAYAPEPPFQSGTPQTAPPEILEAARRDVAELIARREATARRVAARLGVAELQQRG